MTKEFTAKYSGKCALSKKAIKAGDKVVYFGDLGLCLAAEVASQGSKTASSREDIRIEYPAAGATYNRPVFGVYQYSVYPRSSVLPGQIRRQFLRSFDTVEQAREIYPGAEITSSCYQPVYVDHLSAEGDYYDAEDHTA